MSTHDTEPIDAGPVEAGLLRARWRLAFASAEAALRASVHDLPPDEIREHGAILAAERAAAGRLLEDYAHSRRSDEPHTHLLLPPLDAKRILRLPLDVRACVFNLDGVLVGSAAVHAAAWTTTFDEFLSRRSEETHGTFPPFSPRTDYLLHLHGRPRLEGVRNFLASRGVRLPEGSPGDAPGEETVHGLANRKNAVLRALLERNELRAYGGARDYLETAKDAGLRSAVLSASANTDTILEQTGLASLVDGKVDGNVIVEQGLRPRPSPDILLEACVRLGATPRETAVFESSGAGVAAACVAGAALVVGVGQGGEERQLRAAGADLVVAGLEELIDGKVLV